MFDTEGSRVSAGAYSGDDKQAITSRGPALTSPRPAPRPPPARAAHTCRSFLSLPRVRGAGGRDHEHSGSTRAPRRTCSRDSVRRQQTTMTAGDL
ncbi:hypothetical protein JYU34_001740 [Plutella xylostella]|uniref:Uncharacterized protein n=1 Tax=Plutella xylostella TaxID=51655 RepID=A0ABQ7R4S8_PLUXY|nr:hypothetical protein JYU34_001740 [Plutella xylostella]